MLFVHIHFPPRRKDGKTVKANLNPDLLNRSIADDPEVMKAFVDAIQDPVTRQQIISILEEAELLPVSIRRPA
jgi:hypothetical protein